MTLAPRIQNALLFLLALIALLCFTTAVGHADEILGNGPVERRTASRVFRG